MKFEYLLFNAGCFFSVALSSLLFKKRLAHMDKKGVLISIALVAVPFILLDNLVTGYFWYFNPEFVLGFNLIRIPVEEALFFITVPFACLFLWVNIKQRLILRSRKVPMVREIILMILIIILGVTVYRGMCYTTTVAALAILAIALDHVLHIKIYEVLGWYCFLFGVLVLTLIFNYYLTSRPVVLYFDDVKSGLMVLTIPIEDFLFGLSLVSMGVSLYEKLVNTVKVH